jgi:hypothetical protein
MKTYISYIIMSLIIFNIIFNVYYFFKIINLSYTNVFEFSIYINIVIVNLMIILIDILFILINFFVKFNYYRMIGLGIFIGFLIIMFCKYNFNYLLSDYLFILSFTTIDSIFISYSYSYRK